MVSSDEFLVPVAPNVEQKRTRIFVGICIGSILFLQLFAQLANASSPEFTRPWENQTWIMKNPKIWNYGNLEIWWGISTLDQTLESLRVDAISDVGMNGSALQQATAAKIARQKAAADMAHCMTIKELNPLWLASPVAGMAEETLKLFLTVDECLAYKLDWKNTVNGSLASLETGMKSADRSVSNARANYAKLNDTGLCTASIRIAGGANARIGVDTEDSADENETKATETDEMQRMPWEQACTENAAAFSAVDNSVMDGKYGKYPLLLNYSKQLKYELARPVPDLSSVGVMMALIWADDGIIKSYDYISAQGMAAMAAAQEKFGAIKSNAELGKLIAEDRITELERDDLALIDRAPAIYQASNQQESISGQLAGLKDSEENLAVDLQQADATVSRTFERGYLARALGQVSEADREYAKLVAKLDNLKAGAKKAVEQQRGEATSELAQTEAFMAAKVRPTEAKELYEQAKASFENAERAGTGGKKFVAYSKAAAMARAARSPVAHGNELEVAGNITELEALIKNAEKDGINVAAEKALLPLLPELGTDEAALEISTATQNIIAKAKAKYDDNLLETRARILDKLGLAGEPVADLRTDLERYEDGLVIENEEGGKARNDTGATKTALAYPSVIGQLKILKDNYEGLESTLDGYLATAIGNAMSTRLTPKVDKVALDEPSTISLDLVLANPREYSADNVTVRVSLDQIGGMGKQAGQPWQFVYSDIVAGKDEIQSIRSDDGDGNDNGDSLLLVFDKVAPFETKHIIFEKQVVLAHTTKKETSAEGIGNDAAHVTESVEFGLDANIQLALFSGPNGICQVNGGRGSEGEVTESSWKIDGISVDETKAQLNGLDGKVLTAGQHRISTTCTIANAYAEGITSSRTYPMGTNSKVEYNIEITPNMDLDSVTVYIDALNDSRIQSFEITTATGEQTKDKTRVSETQYSARILGLHEAKKTVASVSYLVENTQAFVTSQIAILEAGNASLSENARELLDEAMGQADAGNFTKALEYVEKAKATAKEEVKTADKDRKKLESLRTVVQYELEEITHALGETSAPRGANATGALIDRLSARKTELERILNETNIEEDENIENKGDEGSREDGGLGSSNGGRAGNASQEPVGTRINNSIRLLEAVDTGWLAKELITFRKDAYTDYNQLKERFLKAGRTGTPLEFAQYETAINKLEAGGKAAYGIEASVALQGVRSLVESTEIETKNAKDATNRQFEALKSDTQSVLDPYLKEAGCAKGTEYASTFTDTEKSVTQKMKDVEDAIAKEQDPRIVAARISELNRTRQRMVGVLETMKNESADLLAALERRIGQMDSDDQAKKTAEEKLAAMRQMASRGEYVNALRAGDAIAKSITSTSTAKQSDSTLLLLGLTAMAIMAVIAVYMLKGKGVGGFLHQLNQSQPGQGGPGQFGQKKALKQLKQVERIEEQDVEGIN